MVRCVLWRSLVAAGGTVCTLSGTRFRHSETWDLGDGVFAGEAGRHSRRRKWAMPNRQSRVDWAPRVLDARQLSIGEPVGWGPGAKAMGSAQTGEPVDTPIMLTDLGIRPVKVEPVGECRRQRRRALGVTVGRGAMIGAGAVVTKDVPPFAVIAGMRAKLLRYRKDSRR